MNPMPQKKNLRPPRARGFTLVEALVVIAMLAIVVTMAAPSFASLIGTMNSKSAAFDLINDLTLARSEAIKRNRAVTVQAVGGAWANGWEVVADAETLRARPALSSALTISGAPAQLQFRPNGRVSDDTAPENLAWSIGSTYSGVTARCVVISPTGSARATHGGCS